MVIIHYVFASLAGMGLLLSVAAHTAALISDPVPGGNFIWLLHIGMFAVWIPTVLVCKEMARQKPNGDFWRTTLRGCPLWMRRTLYVVVAYAVANFVLFIGRTSGQPKPHGNPPAVVIRGFSGHWMLFYSVAFVTMYSAIQRKKFTLTHSRHA